MSRVVKTAGFCKSLLGNFKGQNPDRFYFDVMRTHREVVDHVWSILHPSTRLMQNEENEDSRSSTVSSPGRGSRRANRNHHSHRGSSSSTSANLHHITRSSPSEQSSSMPRREEGESGERAPPLPTRHFHRGSSGQSVPRSRSVHESGLRRATNLQHLPPLPPYSQRSCSSDALIRPNSSHRSHLHTIPTHGPYMASTASFNPYLSPSISEAGSDGEDNLYQGGSECYVTMSSRSEATYLPSTQSDPGTMGRGCRPQSNTSSNPPLPASDTSGAPSDMYITSVDSECSGASYRVNSPPPLYREVDEEHSVPINFDNISSENDVNAAAISLISPIIPMPTSDSSNTVFDFDAAAVLTRTRELEGELQRLRTAMTCRLCKQNPIGATFCPCGHTVCCYQCAQRMHSCWECDETVTSVQRMLLTR